MCYIIKSRLRHNMTQNVKSDFKPKSQITHSSVTHHFHQNDSHVARALRP